MKRKEIEEVSVSIITRMYERFDKVRMDDSEYIPMLKSIIQGSIDTAEENELSDADIEKLNSELFTYAKGLYIQQYLIYNDNEEQDKIKFIGETEEWFKYIYKHEMYPE